MTHNPGMGLLDRIFGNGTGKEREPAAAQASSQFYETESGDDDSQPSRNAPRRELVQVILRDTMRKHGIPSDWIDCRILSTVNRAGRPGLHVNFVVKQAHDRLLAYVFAFQDSFERELARFEPRSREWLLSLGWEFDGFQVEQMPDPRTWAQSAPAPLVPIPAPELQSASAQAAERRANETAKADEDVQRDLLALFAIRDAALAEAAGKPRDAAPEQPEFQPTQPFQDTEEPKR